MKRKFIAIALTALTLTACTEKEPPEETDAMPQEFSASLTETAVLEPVIGSAEDSGTSEAVITVFGQEYSPSDDYITIDMSRAGEKTDVNALVLFDDLRHIAIENAGDKSIDFLDGLTLDSLSIDGSSKPAAELIPTLKKCSFNSLYYWTENDNAGFLEDSNDLFTAFPGCEVRTGQTHSTEAAMPSPLAFYCTREISGDDVIVLHVTNNDQKDCSWVIGDIWVEDMDGKEVAGSRQTADETVAYSYTLDCELNAGITGKGIYELCLEAAPEMPYEGVYTGQTCRSCFLVCSDEVSYPGGEPCKTPDFLEGARLEAFCNAYETTEKYFHLDSEMTAEYAAGHTADEFLREECAGLTRECAYRKSLGKFIDADGNLQAYSAGKGSDISFMAAEFFPVGDNTFMALILKGHPDNPYKVWYEAVNFHMTEGEDGWRFDVFQTWF